MRRLLRFVVPALSALSGCGNEQTDSVCPPGQVCMRSGILSDPGAIDPARSFVKQDQTIILDVLLGLTTFSADGKIIPGLAESWTTSADGLTWTFRLRRAGWSDGRPITASDIIFSLRRLVDPTTGGSYASLIYPIVNAQEINAGKLAPDRLGVEATDPETVVIRLKHPAPYFLSVVAHYGVVPVPEHAVRRWGDSWTQPSRLVSSGPYKLASWSLGDRLTLVRNPRFYDAKNVCLDRVDYFPTPDHVLAERRVRRGELDLHPSYDPARGRYLRSARGIPQFVKQYPWTDPVYVVFNFAEPKFRDPRVRRALSMAIDREFIAERVLAGGVDETDSFVPPAIGSVPAKPEWAQLSFDQRMEVARRLLASAGYGPDNPLRVTLKSSITTGVPTPIAADWRKLGVQVTLARADVAVFFNDLQYGDFDAALTDWIADYPDPTNFLNLVRKGHQANYGRFEDARFERLMEQAEREPDLAQRATMLRRAEALLLNSAAVAPVFVNPSHNLVNPRITGWADNVEDVHLMRWMCWKGVRQPARTSATQ